MHEDVLSAVSLDACADRMLKWLRGVKPPSDLRTGLLLRPNWKPLYFIAISPRSGSTMLCSSLSCIPELGQPEEYLNARGALQHFHREFGGGNLFEYLQGAVRARGPAQTLGIKTAYLDFQLLAESCLGPQLAEHANFVYLTRCDIYAQAVSLWAARTTAMWHSSDGSLSPVGMDRYSLKALLPELHRLLRERMCWESYFSVAQITPLRLVYEDLCRSGPAESVLSVARHIGFDINPTLVTNISASTTKTSADTQEAIALRLRSDCAKEQVWQQLFPRSAASVKSWVSGWWRTIASRR